MTPGQAYHLGHDSAASGFFFDSMEMIAAASPAAGGVDALRGAVALLFAERAATNARIDRVVATCNGAFGGGWTRPQGVDEYRILLTRGVFEIVNRWSYIDDIHQVTRLQAWFYAGFGLGRGQTVLRGIGLLEALVQALDGAPPPVDQMPVNLHKLAAESAKQMEVAAAEDDLDAVRPLFEDAARRLQAAALRLQQPAEQVRSDATCAADLQALVDTAHKLALDFAGGAR